MKKLIEDILQNGRTKKWLDYAKEYNIREGFPDKVRLKAANDVWRNYTKNKSIKKVLFFDVETAPLKAYAWAMWDNSFHNRDMVIQKEWFVLTWSAKWMNKNKMHNCCLTLEETEAENDERVVTEMWKMLDEAHIIVAHNAKRFDVKILNGRFLKYGLPAPSPYVVIDTLTVVKSKFRLPSNALNDVCEFLGLGKKVDTGGFKLWRNFLEGSKEARDKMLFYNDKDVYILEQLYYKIRCWISAHPNVNIRDSFENCPTCSSSNIEVDGTHPTTLVKSNVAYICNTCKSRCRKTRKSLKSI